MHDYVTYNQGAAQFNIRYKDFLLGSKIGLTGELRSKTNLLKKLSIYI